MPWGLFATVCACLLAVLPPAAAQPYPAKPVRLLVGFTAGSAPDVIARLIAPAFLEQLGQPLVIENRGGAGGSIATEAATKATPDGHTLNMMAAADTLQPALRRNLAYDIERDLAPVSLVAVGMGVLAVTTALPAANLKELIALARAQPGKLSFGSSGIGSSSHLMGELLNSMAGVRITHVPYKGSADSAIATAAGQVDMSFPNAASVGALLDAGKVRVIAVTGPKRAFSLPNVPTMHEAGLAGYDRSTWFGILAPAGTPREIIGRLNTALVRIGAAPEMKAAMNKQGLDLETTTPEQFAALIKREIALNGNLIRQAGVKPE
jgi:tripartite-type tricarboxylate transporter receptor subunit TctC